MLKVFLQTHGCQMNEYDSKKMLGALSPVKLQETAETAEILLLNTCSIREKAQEKVFSLLGRWHKLKQKDPNVIIAVGGCVAQQEGALLAKRAPYVDVVFGPQTVHRLPKLIERAKKERKTVIDITFPMIEKFDSIKLEKQPNVSEYVTIMEGCNKYCSYCIVPYTRGYEESRSFIDIIKEVSDLAKKGVKEITLLGQNVNAYKGVGKNNKLYDLGTLIHYVAEIEGIERIRFTTSHPQNLTDSLIAAFNNVPKLVSHFHLPVQSGSNKILGLMKRGYTRERYLEIIDKLKLARADIKISSDFIVGFPGETHDDFMETISLIEQVKFDRSFSFIYSKRPGTPAERLHDPIDLQEKKQRLQILQEHLSNFTNYYSSGLQDQILPVLVTGTSKTDHTRLSGRTACNRVVNFHADHVAVGKILPLRITEVKANSLVGEICVA